MGQSSGIGVLDKAVAVLKATAATPIGLAELCDATGLPRATAHRIAVGLETHGLVARDSQGRWRPGPFLGVLATHAPDALVVAATDVLPQLRDRTGESVQLYRADGLMRVCIAVAEPSTGLRDTVPLGARISMGAGSGAKVLTAWANSATQRAILAQAVFTEKTLSEVRRRGWAQSLAEREPGVASVSVPVKDRGGNVIAAMSVSGPTDRIGRRPGTKWAGQLVRASEQLTAQLIRTTRQVATAAPAENQK